jgi:hypothetical protein
VYLTFAPSASERNLCKLKVVVSSNALRAMARGNAGKTKSLPSLGAWIETKKGCPMAETKVFRKDCELYDGEIIAFFSKRVVVSDEEDEYRSYESDNVRVSVGKDGHLSVSDWNRDNSVYFYADQLEHLQKALEIALKQRSLTQRAPDAAYCACKRPTAYVNRICKKCGKPHAPRR